MKKLFMLLLSALLVFSLIPVTVSADGADWVRDGLAALYDGANNTAAGQNKETSVWEDTSGNGVNFEIDLDDANYWTDNAFHANSAWCYFDDAIVEVVNGNKFSVEIVFGEFIGYGESFNTFLNSDNDNFAWFIRNDGDFLEFKNAGNSRPKVAGGMDFVNNSTLTVTFDLDEAECFMYVDGELIGEQYPATTVGADTMFLAHMDASRNWEGDIHCIRFYNTALTAEQVAANAAVDQAKYFATAAADTATTATETAGTPVTDIHDGITYAEWGTPSIDAVKEDVWKNAQSIKIEDIAITSPIDEYATAEVSSLWDGEFLYFFAEVTDPTVAAQLQDAAWDQDAIGFMIDYAYDRTPEKNYRDLGDAAYAGYINVPAVEGDAKYPEAPSIFGIKAYADAVESYTTLTSKGYDVEIKMPLSLYKEYAAGDMLGYEICLNNSGFEETYVRDSQTVWKHADGANGENSWQYTANMGTLILNPAPVVEEAPVVTEVAEEAPVATEVVEEAPVEEVAPVEEAPVATEVAEEVAEEAVEEVVTEETVVAETAPQTFDFGVIAAVTALISLAGYTITKKH